MKTFKTLHYLVLLSLFFLFVPTQAQTVGGILKRKVNKTIDKTIDEGLNEVEGKETKEEIENKTVTEVVYKTASKDFINPANIIFTDDFNYEREGEFPSKWTLLNGTMQNSQVVALGKKEGVVQFINSSKFKPTFKNDDYLGDSFKIEVQCYFHKKGNESYTLNLMNKNKIYGAYQITIRSDGIVPAGASSEYVRMPYKLPIGWRTVQVSFNHGVLKVLYEGYQLINIPDLKTSEENHLTEFSHLEVKALSHGSGEFDSMINYVTIAHGGLPLYRRLMEEGRIIAHDILFEVNSYTIKSSSYPSLDNIVTMLLAHPEISINIGGHTDSDGSLKSNQTLSENRANSIRNYLISKNVSANRLVSQGYGEGKPIDSGNTVEAKALNRRVEFVLQQ